uniref:Uncharacterized protein n=1 Tax=Bubo bubo TaxID=30461 RepID=A0A8C0FBU1_BUBBB
RARVHHHPHDPLQGVQQRVLADERGSDPGLQRGAVAVDPRGPSSARGAGGLRSKRSISMNGMLVQSDSSGVDSRKATFSSSEWILESTV